MAVQDAELKLKVSLDLAFFRQQLLGLGQAAAGTSVPIQVKFDRRTIQNELNTLGRNISQRTYRLEVATNIEAEIRNAQKLAKLLREMPAGSRGVAGVTSKGFGQKAFLGVSPSEIKQLYKAAADAGLVAFRESIANNKREIAKELGLVGKDSIAGLVNGLNSQNPALRKAAQTLGEDLLASVKGVLGIASPSREFKKIGENVGQGFQQGMLSSMDKAFDAVEDLMRARMRVLDTIARGVFRFVGMDPVALRAEAAQRRALPGVNFPATVPSRNIPIGPSGTGRALPPGATPSALPGTAFGSQRYLPTALSDELKTILRGAAFAFVDSIKQQTRSVRVGLAASQQPLLGGSRIAGLLPAGVGRVSNVYSTGAIGGETRAEMMARREREARMRSALRGMDVMGGGAGRPAAPYSYSYRGARPTGAIIPYAAAGALVAQPGGPPSGPPGGGGGLRGMVGQFSRALGNIQLPGAGMVRELGDEFGMATKQVLLFGTAYKALAFATSFPAQVGQAVGALQTFNNTLKAISPTAQEVKSSNKLILDLVDKYNVPLQSARDGFTKLYASMQPAGFSGDEVRAVFTGISKAAAAFGMSADKVDRVNYAFAQMASKGQVMSEELKGQLGDVLPGAMAIFAEAAGFKGPDAIQKFSAALEEGAYKGRAMKVLLQNVGTIMNKEFGPGAEGAARTFQGAMNRMQNSLTLLYEGFEPIAVGFLNAVVMPLTDGIKQVTDGLNAFLTGTAAKTTGGFAFAQQLTQLKPAFDGITANIRTILPLFSQFGQIALGVGKVLLQIAGNPLAGYLARIYAIVLPLTIAFSAIRNVITGVVASVMSMNGAVLLGTQRLATFRSIMQATNLTASQVATGLRIATAAFMTLGSAGVLLAIGALIERMFALKGALDSISQSTIAMRGNISGMANAGMVGGLKNVSKDLQNQLRTYEQLKPLVGGGTFGPKRQPSKQEAQKMQELGLGGFLGTDIFGKPFINDFVDASRIVEARIQQLRSNIQNVNQKLPLATKIAESMKPPSAAAIAPIPPGEGTDKEKEKAAQKAAEDARKLADEKRRYESELLKINAAQAMDLDDAAFDHWKTLQDEKFNYLEAGQNAWMKNELKLQRDLQQIEIQRIEAIRKARQETQKAEVEANARAMVAQEQAPFGGAATFGATGRSFNAPGWVHGHFQNMDRASLVQDTTDTVMRLISQGVPTELGSGQKFTKGMGRDQVEALVKRGIGSHKKYASGIGAIDVFVPEGTKVPMPLSGVGNLGGAAGISGRLSGGTQLMHLAVGSRSSTEGNAARQRKEVTKDHNAQLAVIGAINKKELEAAQIKLSNEAAQQKVNTAIKEYVASIAPVEQQKLENSLLATRIKLMRSGAFGESLDVQMQMAEAETKRVLGVQLATAAIVDNEAKIKANNEAVKIGAKGIAQANAENEVYARGIATNTQKIGELNQATQDYIPTLQEKLRLAQQAAEVELQGAIQQATPLGGRGLSLGFIGESGEQAASAFDRAIGAGKTQEQAKADAQYFGELQNKLTLLEARNNAIKSSIMGIGDAFATAMTTGVASLIDGTASAQEVFSNFLKSIGQALTQAAAQMIATYIAIGIARIFAGMSGGGGLEARTPSGNAAFMDRVSKLDLAGSAYANGGIAFGGFRAFANGGVVNGPTLGLVGEGKYNEAIVPLPDGKSIPVMMRGGQPSSRDLIGGSMSQAMAPVLSMSFESTTINGVEYVSRDQLEQAMMDTRKAAAREGAARGATLAIDKLQQSPSTRRRIGLS
jgi:tape measure domain-containing protein